MAAAYTAAPATAPTPMPTDMPLTGEELAESPPIGAPSKDDDVVAADSPLVLLAPVRLKLDP